MQDLHTIAKILLFVSVSQVILICGPRRVTINMNYGIKTVRCDDSSVFHGNWDLKILNPELSEVSDYSVTLHHGRSLVNRADLPHSLASLLEVLKVELSLRRCGNSFKCRR